MENDCSVARLTRNFFPVGVLGLILRSAPTGPAEGRPLGRVSKDGLLARAYRPSFETHRHRAALRADPLAMLLRMRPKSFRRDAVRAGVFGERVVADRPDRRE